ncbi:MAG: potassium channel family protein [Desulfobacterales bacterium]
MASYGAGNIIRALILLGLVLLIGTAGYAVIEGWKILDAIYMTVITITTVGYGEVRAVSPTGRVFTIALICMGMGIIAYTLGMVAQVMVELQVRSIFGRKKLGLKIKSIKNHYVLCGYGRIGRIISQELKASRIPLLVIDSNPDSKQGLEQQDIPYIIDDATSEDVLIEAGIERAKGLISVVLSDADNLFITMTARGLNPGLFILARAEEEKSHKKLLRAGANRVVLPYLIGGQKMAHTITKPAVADFLELTVHDKSIELEMGEVLVKDRSRLKGVTLADSGIRQEMNVIIVAIRKENGEMAFNPSSETRIETGDTLIALGPDNDLKKLSAILSGE